MIAKVSRGRAGTVKTVISAVAMIAAAQLAPQWGGPDTGFIGTAQAQTRGQGRGGMGGGGMGGGGMGGAGGMHGPGTGQGGAGGGVEGKIIHAPSTSPSASEESDSDRPAWAGVKGGKAGAGGKPGTAGVKKGDLYGDLWVILRDANGVPILDQYGHVQPLDAEGNLIPLDAEGTPLDPTKVVEVELSRLSVGRSPSKVLDRQYNEAINTLNSATSITTDASGRLVVTNPDGTTASIDSPLENLALYKTLLSNGYLPGLTASDAVLGSLTFLKDPSFTTADYKQAASLLGAASDKTGSISVDTVAYMDSFLKVAGTITGPDGRSYVDFSTYTYDRATAYPGTVTILVKNADGTYTKQTVSLLEAVFNNQTYTGTGVSAFATAADDARAVIQFVHDNPVPTD